MPRHDDAAFLRRIEGVVQDVGGALTPTPNLIIVILSPWREVDGSVRRTGLRFEMPENGPQTIHNAMQAWPGRVVRVTIERLRKAAGNALEWNVARSELEWLDPASTPPALRSRGTLPKPPRSKVIGSLRWSTDRGGFEGRRRAGLRRYTVVAIAPDPDDAPLAAGAIQRADAVVLALERRMPELRAAIAGALLETHNENWRSDGRPLTEAAFKRRLRLCEVEVDTDRVTLFFDSKTLFGEHGVECRLTADLGVAEVCIS